MYSTLINKGIITRKYERCGFSKFKTKGHSALRELRPELVWMQKSWRKNFNFFDLARHVIIDDYIGKIKPQFAFQRAGCNDAIAICTRITQLGEHSIQIYCCETGCWTLLILWNIILESGFILYIFRLISEVPRLQDLFFILWIILYNE